MDYSGTAHTTIGGLTCQAWPVQDSEYDRLGGNNYCRNPDGDSGGVWCYTTDHDKGYDYCSVPLCGTGMLGCNFYTPYSRLPPSYG